VNALLIWVIYFADVLKVSVEFNSSVFCLLSLDAHDLLYCLSDVERLDVNSKLPRLDLGVV